MEIIRFTKQYREVPAGNLIFQEGEPAKSLFTVVGGKVEIFRQGPDGPETVIELGPDEVFGEMGLLIRAGRTASAKAAEDTLLFEISNEAVKNMGDVCGPEPTIRLMQNLVLILSERLAKQNMRSQSMPTSWLAQTIGEETKDALPTVAGALPKTLLSKSPKTHKLREGEYLCHEGGEPDGFYFVHEGTLHVSRKRPGHSTPATLQILEAPTICGQAAYFGNTKRNASIMAINEVVYSHYTASEFEKMKTKTPDKALEVLYATTQYLVYWLARG